jgi:hypothetical protein
VSRSDTTDGRASITASPVAANGDCHRRQVLQLAALVAVTLSRPAFATEPATGADVAGVSTFSNASQGYSLQIPNAWEQYGKAGADAIFRDPAVKSTTVGITVLPVMVKRLEDFGTLDSVAQKLLNAGK